MTSIHQFLSKRFFVLAWITLVALLLSQLLGRQFWQLELFSHYTPHGAIGLFVAGLCYPKSRPKLGRWFFLITGTSLLLWSFTPFYVYHQWLQSSAEKSVSIAYQNVRVDNQHHAKTLEQLTQANADIILLVEAGGDVWNRKVATLTSRYPVHCGNNDFAFFAIQAFVADKETRCELLNIAEIPTIKITRPDNKIIYGIHPPPPLDVVLMKKQREFLHVFKSRLVDDFKNSNSDIIVIGDMNLSAFSPTYRDFMENSELKRTMLNATPTWLPFAISIDQILTNNQHNIKIKALDWQGSDHRGYLVNW